MSAAASPGRDEPVPPSSVEASGARSVGAQTINGNVLTGDVRAPVVLPDPATIAAPRELHNLPAPTEALFVGRGSELRLLEATVRSGREPSTQVITQAVSGLGGVGKSTLALHYAHAHHRDHSATWWITAESAETITTSLADLARHLLSRWDTSGFPDQVLAEWALAWLHHHPGWLLIFDNATGPEPLAPYLARATAGTCLITSRLATGWRRVSRRRPLRLDVFPLPTATLLLLRLAERGASPADRKQARALADELGRFPLALNHAGAYIARTRTGFAAYRELLRTQPSRVLVGQGDPNAVTIARTWRITLDVLAERHPHAVPLLRVLAWLGPDRLPRDVLAGEGTDVAALDEALAHLADFSMITLDEEAITTHRLVQALARTPDADDPHRQPEDIERARTSAGGLLVQATPADTTDDAASPRWRAVQAHVEAYLAQVDPYDATGFTDLLLYRASRFMREQGRLRQAIAYAERSVVVSTGLRGPDHLGTLISRNNLADAYESAGDLGRAIPLYQQLLDDSLRVLGPDHPSTLHSRNNLASAYESAGDLGRAIPLFEQTLNDSLRVLGPDHPSTLTCRNNLAYAYRQAGDLDRAIPLFEQTLNDRLLVLGPDHLDTLGSRNNLAGAYESAGDLGRAIPLFEQTLNDSLRVLGPDHPHTLVARNNLAGAYAATGNLERVIPLFEQTLNDSLRVLGPDHPYTLTARNNLAGANAATGNLDRAIPLFQQTLNDRLRVLGPDHPSTLTSRSNLAHAYRQAGDLDRATSLDEQTLNDSVRVLGPDHPRTKALMAQLSRITAPEN